MTILLLYFNILKRNRLKLFNNAISYFSPNIFPLKTISSAHTIQNKFRKYNDLNKSIENLDAKMELISKLNFESDTHAAPFYKLPVSSLLQVYIATKHDQENGFCKNRLYYIASHLKCPSAMLSERLAKRIFIYTLSFDWLQKSLNILIEKGVSPDRIIRDLWVLKYHHQTIEDRLQSITDLGIDTLYPWMVRCSENILNRYIEIYQETKTILGDNKSTKLYITNRLNISLNTVEEMYAKVPALERIRVTKVKIFLDFLFEEGFTIEDIINKPRVLSSSQKTVKQRLEKLRNLGLKDINLNVLCRSRKGFRKYYESLNSVNKDEKHSQ